MPKRKVKKKSLIGYVRKEWLLSWQESYNTLPVCKYVVHSLVTNKKIKLGSEQFHHTIKVRITIEEI